jgi:hypothetical protein
MKVSAGDEQRITSRVQYQVLCTVSAVLARGLTMSQVASKVMEAGMVTRAMATCILAATWPQQGDAATEYASRQLSTSRYNQKEQHVRQGTCKSWTQLSARCKQRITSKLLVKCTVSAVLARGLTMSQVALRDMEAGMVARAMATCILAATWAQRGTEATEYASRQCMCWASATQIRVHRGALKSQA